MEDLSEVYNTTNRKTLIYLVSSADWRPITT